MTRRIISALMVILLLPALMAACGGEPEPQPAPTQAPAEPMPTSASPSPAPPPVPLPPGTLEPQPAPEPTVAPPLPPATETAEPEPAAWAADGVISPGEYLIAIEYDAWQVSWRTDDRYAYFGLRAATEGFVSLGIQPGRMMKDADMIFGYVADGAVTVVDMYSTGNFGPHPADIAQGGTDDILEAGGSESGGFTVIEFKRALVTGDAYDLPLEPGSNKIIWAYGAADSPTGEHSSRGYGEIIIE